MPTVSPLRIIEGAEKAPPKVTYSEFQVPLSLPMSAEAEYIATSRKSSRTLMSMVEPLRIIDGAAEAESMPAITLRFQAPVPMTAQ
jgi:hypothetical protein